MVLPAIPSSVAGAVGIDGLKNAKFNPLSLLSSAPALGFSSSSSADGRQFNNYFSPFQVGSGQLDARNDATASQGTSPVIQPAAVGGGLSGDITTILLIGGAVWIATQILK